ncbi:hypothetical protein GGR56DRAFT_677909 [Xylariaceae sp. FL0804]|nr:hypothetical protein GGR56DRAFT_677909 [Xylariaceae sp. FL0804]
MGYTFADIIAEPGIGPIVIISLVTIPLTIAATSLRLVATRRSRRPLSWDDLFAVLALVGHLGYTVTPVGAIPGAADLTTEQAAVLTAKLSYIATPFYYVNQLFAKASLFVLYHRVFWSDRAFVRWIYALAAVHVAWFVTFFFLVLFLCRPVSKWWDVAGTQPGRCIDGNAFLVPEETINSAVDLAMVGLTVAMVLGLRTREHVKRRLAFVFTLGGLSGVIGFVKIGITYHADDDNGQENNASAFWDILQMSTSIFCACAPMYKTLTPVHIFWARKKQMSRSWSGRSLLGSSNARSSAGGSKDRTPSSDRDSRGDGERGPDASWGSLIRRPQVASAGGSDVELEHVHVPSSQWSKHPTKTSGRFDKNEYNMV